MRSTKTIVRALLGFLALIPVLPAQSVVGTITRPNLYPTAVTVDEARNRVFVADQTSQTLYVYDGVTYAELNSVFVGTGVYNLVVSQSAGKLYALSQDSGVITVVDVSTLAPITMFSGFNGPSGGLASDLRLDALAGKLYAMAAQTGLFQIDVANDPPYQCRAYLPDR
jgi:DNA-binding beta-propeller fold protein YncE